MPVYDVRVGRKAWQTAHIRIEADTKEQAEDHADKLISTEGEDSLEWHTGGPDGPCEVEEALEADE